MAEAFSDDFGDASIDSRWEFENNTGNGTEAESGGTLQLGVPSGATHDWWRTSTSNRDGLGELQPIDNTDLDLVVHFPSAPAANTAQGITVMVDDDSFYRFDVRSSSGSYFLFFGWVVQPSTGVTLLNTNIGGTFNVPYLRITRVGNDWEVFTSPDGVDWTSRDTDTRTITVGRAGFWAGNFSTNPAASIAATDFINLNAPAELTVDAQVANSSWSGLEATAALSALLASAEVANITMSGLEATAALSALLASAEVASIAMSGLEATVEVVGALEASAEIASLQLIGLEATAEAAPAETDAEVASILLSGLAATVEAPSSADAQVAVIEMGGYDATIGPLAVIAEVANSLWGGTFATVEGGEGGALGYTKRMDRRLMVMRGRRKV